MIELLHNTKFVPDRIRVLANKLINDVATSRKSGDKICKELRKILTYNKCECIVKYADNGNYS